MTDTDNVIYKLHCNITNEDYYGSTKWYNNRISSHKCSTEKQMSKRQCMSRQIIDRGNYTFSIMEEGVSSDDLKIRENFYFENYPCINKNPPYKSKEQLKEDRRLYSKQHPEIKAKYRDEHKKELVEKQMNRYLANKDEINEKRRQVIVCECGMETRTGHKARHEKTKSHQLWKEKGIVYTKPEQTYEQSKYNKHVCVCGGCYIISHKTTHEKTKRHQDYLLTIQSAVYNPSTMRV